MILTTLLNDIGLQTMINILAHHADDMLQTDLANKNRKAYKRFREDVGDTILYALQNQLFTMTPELGAGQILCFTKDKTELYSKNLQRVMSHKRYNKIRHLVSQMNIDEILEMVKQAHLLKKMDNSLEDAHVDYTPGDEEPTPDFIECEG